MQHIIVHLVRCDQGQFLWRTKYTPDSEHTKLTDYLDNGTCTLGYT